MSEILQQFLVLFLILSLLLNLVLITGLCVTTHSAVPKHTFDDPVNRKRLQRFVNKYNIGVDKIDEHV